MKTYENFIFESKYDGIETITQEEFKEYVNNNNEIWTDSHCILARLKKYKL